MRLFRYKLLLVLLLCSQSLSAQQIACIAAHEKIVSTQQSLLTLQDKLDEYLANKPFYNIDTIIAHEQALQQKYKAELELFRFISKIYADADDALGRVKNFLLSTNSGCNLEASRRNPMQLWEAFRQNPAQFGRPIQTFDASATMNSDKIKQYTLIQNFINADKRAESLAFDRLAAEKGLLESLRRQYKKEQQFREDLLTAETIQVIQDKNPRCFRGVRDITSPNYQIANLLQRDVPFDVAPVVKNAVCQIGIDDPNWLAGNNLAVLRQRLENSIKVPNDKASLQWQSQRQNISAYNRLLRQSALEASKIQDPARRQQRINELLTKKQEAVNLQGYLQTQMPESIINWQSSRRRLTSFDQLVDRTGLDRLSYHYNVDDRSRLESLKQAERKFGKNFVRFPDNADLNLTSHLSGSYLQGLLNYSQFYENKMRQVVQQMVQVDQQNNYITATRCAINNTIEANFKLIKPACLSKSSFLRLNNIVKNWSIENK